MRTVRPPLDRGTSFRTTLLSEGSLSASAIYAHVVGGVRVRVGCPHVPRQGDRCHEPVAAGTFRPLLNLHAFDGCGCVKRRGPTDKHVPAHKEPTAGRSEGRRGTVGGYACVLNRRHDLSGTGTNVIMTTDLSGTAPGQTCAPTSRGVTTLLYHGEAVDIMGKEGKQTTDEQN